MNKLILTISYLLICFCNTLAQNQVCTDEDWAFSAGEKLIYKVYYNWSFVWVPAGEVTFEVKESDSTYLLKVTGMSYPSYDPIFKVRDYYQSEINKEDLKPCRFKRNVEEGEYVKYDSIAFDWKNEQCEYFRGKAKGDLKRSELDITSCLFDLVSACYYLRNQERESILEGLAIDILYDHEVHNIDIVSNGRENKRIKNIGKIPSIKVSPELVTGSVFKEGDIMNIWVSDDENKIPVLVESPIFVGSIKAVLQSYEHLKYHSILTDYEK